MIEENVNEGKENLELVTMASVAIPIDFETFSLALKLGGKLIFDNEFQKHENGPYFHVLEYNGARYITSTPCFVEKFLI